MFELLPMLGFEPRISIIGSDLSANCATTTAHIPNTLAVKHKHNEFGYPCGYI